MKNQGVAGCENKSIPGREASPAGPTGRRAADERVQLMPLALLAAAAALLFLAGLGSYGLCNPDEPRVAAIAAAVARPGEHAVLMLNGEPFLEQPPLYYWMSGAAMRLLGESDFSARAVSAAAAIAGVLLVFLLARQMGFSHASALLSGFVLATSAEYWEIGRRALTDMTLCAFVIGAMAAFYLAVCGQRRTLLWPVLFAFCLGGAVMTKNLVGLAVPGAALACWLVLERNRSFRPWLILAAGSLFALVPLALWLPSLHGKLGWDGVSEVIWTNNFGRFAGSRESHVEPFYQYLIDFPVQFLPWTLFLPLAVVHAVRAPRTNEHRRPLLFLFAWFIGPFLLLSISAGKRGLYLVPLYPSAALLVGWALGWALESRQEAGKWFRFPVAGLAVLVPGAALALAGAGVYFKEPIVICLLLGLPGLGLGLWAVRRLLRNRPAAAFRVLALAVAVLFVTAGFGAYPVLDQARSYARLVDSLEMVAAQGGSVGLFKPNESMRGAAYFYLKRELPVLGTPPALARFLEICGAVAVVDPEKLGAAAEDFVRVGSFDIGRRTYEVVAGRQFMESKSEAVDVANGRE